MKTSDTVVLKVRWDITSAVGEMGNAAGHLTPEMQKYAAQMADMAVKSMTSALSVGYGTYVLVAASIVLAAHVLRSGPA